MAMREGQNLSAKKCFRTSKSDKIRKRIMLCCSPKGVNGMIEIIYKEDQKKSGEKDRFFRIPNNIRQIGEIRGHQKIYIEDYAYTFLKKISRNGAGEGQAAILLGQYHWSEGCAYLFIRSALQIDDMEVSPDHLAFTDKVWGQIYEEEKKYFPEQEIVGWFVSLPGFNMEISEGMLKTHLNHFAGNDKTLFVMEPGEREEAFFLYEGGRLTRQPGFYIYYEKNEAMQAYMIEKSQNKSIEETEKIPDRAVVDFRKAVKDKKEKEQEAAAPAKKRVVWMAGACTAAAVLAVGITFFNSYQGMENTMGTLLEGNSSAGEDMAAAEAGAGVQENPDAAGQTDSAGEDTPAAETPQDAGVQEGASGADETAEDQSGQNTASLTDGAEAAGSSTGGADGSGTAGSAADGSGGAGTADSAADGADGSGTVGSAADGADGSGTVGSASAGADGSGTAGSAADGSDGTGTGDSASSSGNSGGTDSAGLTSSSDAADGTDAAASGSQSQVLISPEALNPDNTQQETTVSGSASGVRQYTIRRGDTLSSICEAQYGTIARIDEVCRLNGISPEDIIYAGQKILLPE